MNYRLEKIAYSLAIFILMNGLFVISDNSYQITDNMRQEFSKAFIQTIGDQPFITEELALIYDSLDNFYKQTAAETIALLNPKGADDDIIAVGRQVYLSLANVFTYQGQVAGEGIDANIQIDTNYTNQEFMTEEPIWNIVPENN